MCNVRKAASVALAALTLQATATGAGEFKQFHRDVRLNQTLQERANNGAGVRVAVIDTDIDLNHREYRDRVVAVIKHPSYPYATPGNHGTFVTGVIAAARDGRGMVGMAPEARIISAWLLDEDGATSYPGPGGSLADWFVKIRQRNPNVINASIGPVTGGCVFNCDDGLRALSTVSGRATVALAAGNDGAPLKDVRCRSGNRELCRHPEDHFGNVVIVGALDDQGRLASFSNRPGGACFERRSDGSCAPDHRLREWFLVAPGTQVDGTLPGNRYGQGTGTSAAAPIVSGAAALVMSRWPHLKQQPDQVARILLQSADDLGQPGVDNRFGHGRLNVRAALQPLGSTVLATGDRVGDGGSAPQATGLATTSVFGRRLPRALASTRAAVFDDFGRDFTVEMAGFAQAEGSEVHAQELFEAFMSGPPPRAATPVGAPALRMALAAESDPYGHLPVDGLMLALVEGPLQVGAANDHDASALADALAGSAATPDPITAFRADGRHLSLVGPARVFGGGYDLGGPVGAWLGVTLAQRSSAPHEDVLAGGDDATGLELRGRLEPLAGLTLRASSGFLEERGSVLGTEGSGALALDGSTTYYLGAGLSAALGGGFSLDVDLETGWLGLDAAGGALLEDGGGLRTETARASLTGRGLWLERDVAAFSISQPLRVVAGDLRLNLPVGRTTEGRDPVQRHRPVGGARRAGASAGARLRRPAAAGPGSLAGLAGRAARPRPRPRPRSGDLAARESQRRVLIARAAGARGRRCRLRASRRQGLDRKRRIVSAPSRPDLRVKTRWPAATALLLLAGCAAAEPELWRAGRGFVWCYRALAGPECHREPRPDAADRLIAAAPQRFFAPLAAGSAPERAPATGHPR